MKLADEIRAITIPPSPMRLESEAVWALRKAIELVEKREAERAERIKRMRSTVIPAIGSDIRDGWNLAIDHVLESEAKQ